MWGGHSAGNLLGRGPVQLRTFSVLPPANCMKLVLFIRTDDLFDVNLQNESLSV